MEYRWYPPKDLVYSSNVYSFMEARGFKDYRDLVEASVRDPRWFWGSLPEILGIEWFRDPKEVLDLSRGPEWVSWYVGGRINASYIALDLQVRRGLGSSEAFTWVGEDNVVKRYTYSDLLREVNSLAGFLLESGVNAGDVVAIYAPMMPESVVAMLAAMKIGAIAAPIFSGFAPEAVAERLRLSGSRILVTVDGYYRRGRGIALKENADRASDLSGTINRIVVVRRLGIEIPWNDKRDLWYHEAVKRSWRSVEAREMDPNDPALLLFTSGTTGKPKGAVISHAGAILQPAKEHHFNLDIKRGDKLWWITDLGWMMGPWQILGAQTLGASHLMIEGAVDHPPDRAWSIVERFGVTHMGFAATVARILRSLGKTYENHDLSRLRVFGNTGEPIDPATWVWVMRDVGGEKRPIINLSGGTEVFGCILMPSVVTPLKPSTLWGPALGVDADVLDDGGSPVRGSMGYLVVRKPIPSMTRGLWRDPERYLETYWRRFPGIWYHGDWAYIDPEGFWYIFGRADDVIKVAGKRIGSAEIEAVINHLEWVAESACIGIPHEVRGEVIGCFVKPKKWPPEDPEILIAGARKRVADAIGKPFEPDSIYIVRDLPRTRSGKIMRRIIRAIVTGGQLGDISVLENPDSVEYIKKALGA